MPIKKVDHHASVVIVRSDNSRDSRIFLGGYDNGYPKWPGFANIIGGNHQQGVDFTPWDILRREITEETSPEQDDPNYASLKDIVAIRNSILENAKPYKDFLITDPAQRDDKDLTPKGEHLRETIVSCYESVIPKDAINYIERTLASGKKIVSEGKSSVTPIDKLVSGKVLLAWTSPVMMSHYLGKVLPNPYNAKAEEIGNTRHSLIDYLQNFEYVDTITSKHDFD